MDWTYEEEFKVGKAFLDGLSPQEISDKAIVNRTPEEIMFKLCDLRMIDPELKNQRHN